MRNAANHIICRGLLFMAAGVCLGANATAPARAEVSRVHSRTHGDSRRLDFTVGGANLGWCGRPVSELMEFYRETCQADQAPLLTTVRVPSRQLGAEQKAPFEELFLRKNPLGPLAPPKTELTVLPDKTQFLMLFSVALGCDARSEVRRSLGELFAQESKNPLETATLQLFAEYWRRLTAAFPEADAASRMAQDLAGQVKSELPTNSPCYALTASASERDLGLQPTMLRLHEALKGKKVSSVEDIRRYLGARESALLDFLFAPVLGNGFPSLEMMVGMERANHYRNLLLYGPVRVAPHGGGYQTSAAVGRGLVEPREELKPKISSELQQKLHRFMQAAADPSARLLSGDWGTEGKRQLAMLEAQAELFRQFELDARANPERRVALRDYLQDLLARISDVGISEAGSEGQLRGDRVRTFAHWGLSRLDAAFDAQTPNLNEALSADARFLLSEGGTRPVAEAGEALIRLGLRNPPSHTGVGAADSARLLRIHSADPEHRVFQAAREGLDRESYLKLAAQVDQASANYRQQLYGALAGQHPYFYGRKLEQERRQVVESEERKTLETELVRHRVALKSDEMVGVSQKFRPFTLKLAELVLRETPVEGQLEAHNGKRQLLRQLLGQSDSDAAVLGAVAHFFAQEKREETGSLWKELDYATAAAGLRLAPGKSLRDVPTLNSPSERKTVLAEVERVLLNSGSLTDPERDALMLASFLLRGEGHALSAIIPDTSDAGLTAQFSSRLYAATGKATEKRISEIERSGPEGTAAIRAAKKLESELEARGVFVPLANRGAIPSYLSAHGTSGREKLERIRESMPTKSLEELVLSASPSSVAEQVEALAQQADPHAEYLQRDGGIQLQRARTKLQRDLLERGSLSTDNRGLLGVVAQDYPECVAVGEEAAAKVTEDTVTAAQYQAVRKTVEDCILQKLAVDAAAKLLEEKNDSGALALLERHAFGSDPQELLGLAAGSNQMRQKLRGVARASLPSLAETAASSEAIDATTTAEERRRDLEHKWLLEDQRAERARLQQAHGVRQQAENARKHLESLRSELETQKSRAESFLKPLSPAERESLKKLTLEGASTREYNSLMHRLEQAHVGSSPTREELKKYFETENNLARAQRSLTEAYNPARAQARELLAAAEAASDPNQCDVVEAQIFPAATPLASSDSSLVAELARIEKMLGEEGMWNSSGTLGTPATVREELALLRRIASAGGLPSGDWPLLRQHLLQTLVACEGESGKSRAERVLDNAQLTDPELRQRVGDAVDALATSGAWEKESGEAMDYAAVRDLYRQLKTAAAVPPNSTASVLERVRSLLKECENGYCPLSASEREYLASLAARGDLLNQATSSVQAQESLDAEGEERLEVLEFRNRLLAMAREREKANRIQDRVDRINALVDAAAGELSEQERGLLKYSRYASEQAMDWARALAETGARFKGELPADRSATGLKKWFSDHGLGAMAEDFEYALTRGSLVERMSKDQAWAVVAQLLEREGRVVAADAARMREIEERLRPIVSRTDSQFTGANLWDWDKVNLSLLASDTEPNGRGMKTAEFYALLNEYARLKDIRGHALSEGFNVPGRGEDEFHLRMQHAVVGPGGHRDSAAFNSRTAVSIYDFGAESKYVFKDYSNIRPRVERDAEEVRRLLAPNGELYRAMEREAGFIEGTKRLGTSAVGLENANDLYVSQSFDRIAQVIDELRSLGSAPVKVKQPDPKNPGKLVTVEVSAADLAQSYREAYQNFLTKRIENYKGIEEGYNLAEQGTIEAASLLALEVVTMGAASEYVLARVAMRGAALARSLKMGRTAKGLYQTSKYLRSATKAAKGVQWVKRAAEFGRAGLKRANEMYNMGKMGLKGAAWGLGPLAAYQGWNMYQGAGIAEEIDKNGDGVADWREAMENGLPYDFSKHLDPADQDFLSYIDANKNGIPDYYDFEASGDPALLVGSVRQQFKSMRDQFHIMAATGGVGTLLEKLGTFRAAGSVAGTVNARYGPAIMKSFKMQAASFTTNLARGAYNSDRFKSAVAGGHLGRGFWALVDESKTAGKQSMFMTPIDDIAVAGMLTKYPKVPPSAIWAVKSSVNHGIDYVQGFSSATYDEKNKYYTNASGQVFSSRHAAGLFSAAESARMSQYASNPRNAQMDLVPKLAEDFARGQSKQGAPITTTLLDVELPVQNPKPGTKGTIAVRDAIRREADLPDYTNAKSYEAAFVEIFGKSLEARGVAPRDIADLYRKSLEKAGYFEKRFGEVEPFLDRMVRESQLSRLRDGTTSADAIFAAKDSYGYNLHLHRELSVADAVDPARGQMRNGEIEKVVGRVAKDFRIPEAEFKTYVTQYAAQHPQMSVGVTLDSMARDYARQKRQRR